jgi:hypothetical protein
MLLEYQLKHAFVITTAGLFLSFGIATAQPADPSFNLTGVWDTAGGGTAQFYQEGSRVVMVFVGPDFAHRYDAVYTSPTTVTGRQTRVTRATGCSTELLQTVTVVSPDFHTVRAITLDSNCDLVRGQIITNSATRIL